MKVGRKNLRPSPNLGTQSMSCWKLRTEAGTAVPRMLTEFMQKAALVAEKQNFSRLQKEWNY